MSQKERLGEIGKVYNYTGEIPHFNITANSNKSGGMKDVIQATNNISANNIKIQSGKKNQLLQA